MKAQQDLKLQTSKFALWVNPAVKPLQKCCNCSVNKLHEHVDIDYEENTVEEKVAT